MNYKLPEPDTHCFDEDTKTDCWSYSADQMQAAYAAGRKEALEDAADEIKRLTAENAALKADAERYRFIRDGNAYIEPNHYDEDGKVTKEMYMALETGKYYADMRDFDMDIDAGISASKGEKP